MNLGFKIGGITLSAFALAIALGYGIQRSLVLPSFYALEREEATKSLERVVETLSRDLSQLAVSTADWSYWDEMYRFAAADGDYAEFTASTLNLAAVETLHVHVMGVYGLDGQRIWGATVDPTSNDSFDVGELAADALSADHPLLRFAGAEDRVAGLWPSPQGALLVASSQILMSDRSGPPIGTVLLGRLLDDAAVLAIAEQTRLALTIEPWSGAAPAGPWIPSPTLRRSPIEVRASAEGIAAEAVLADATGRPLLVARTITPPAISARGEQAVATALVSTTATALILLLLLLLTLNRLVIMPIGHLTAHAVRVGEADDLRTRLALHRRDEIGALARAFDRMTDRLAETRRHLMEQSFDSGKAELASGVLHNIGNVITPLVVRLVDLQDTLKAAPAAELTLAIAELGRADGDGERRRDLGRFVELAGANVAGLTTRARDELAAITQQVHHVQRILGDQERHSRTTQVIERIDLADLVREGIEMLTPAMRSRLVIHDDGGLTAAGNVLGSRVALQQVVSNLLINAAEAIATRDVGPGRLWIDARPAATGRDLVDVRFTDDGIGMDAGELNRLFERGFSTKKRSGSGLGLHWCAVTVHAMGGHMRAESPGHGHGCTMHLVLPIEPGTSARA